jgi:hypothetical protein
MINRLLYSDAYISEVESAKVVLFASTETSVYMLSDAMEPAAWLEQ